MQKDRWCVIRLYHAVRYGAAKLTSFPHTLSEEHITDLVPSEIRVNSHILDPEEIILITDVMQDLSEDETDDLVILHCDETYAAV